MLKKFLRIVVFIVFCLFIVGCASKDKDHETKTLIEYYQGEEIELPNDISHVCDVWNADGDQYFVITEAKFGLIWKISKDGEWEKIIDKPEELTNCYLNEAVFISGETAFCSFFEQKSEDEIIVLYYLISRDGTFKKLNLDGIGLATDSFSDIEYQADYLCGRNANGEVDMFDITTVEKRYTYKSDIYTNIYCIINNQVMVIGPKGAETYDIEKATRSDDWKYAEEKVYELACEASSYPTRVTYYDDKIYCITVKGIYEIDNVNQKTTVLVGGREQSFGNVNIWIYDFSMHKNDTLTVSMMNTEGENEFWIYKYHPEGVERQVLANEIVVYSLEYDSVLEYDINLFNAKKDNLYVEYKFGTNGLDSVTKGDAIKQLNTELLAGKGPDIILMDGMPKQSYIKKGVLMDISDIISKDHFQNVVNDNYSVPRYFMLTAIMGDNIAVSTKDDFDKFTKNIQKMYKQTPEKYIFDLYFDSCYVDVMYRAYSDMFIENGKINEDYLKRFYLNMNEIADISTLQYVNKAENNKEEVKIDYSYTNVESIDWMSQAAAADDLSVAIGGITNVNDYAKLKSYCSDRKDISWDLYQKNDKTMYIPVQCFSISMNSNNVEGAKEFLSYMISETSYYENERTESGFPLNKNVLKNQMKNVQSWQDEFVKESGETVLLPEISFKKDDENELLELINALSEPSNIDSTLKSLIMEQAERYVNGEGSVEECVQEASEKANIYLME